VFFVLCIVATPFVFVAWLIHRVLEHKAATAHALAAARMPALPSASASAMSPDVERRLANLEAIVASLDFDLAARLREADGKRGHAA
jgi:hypothetical protein